MTEQHEPGPEAPGEQAAPIETAAPPAPKRGAWDEIKEHKALQWTAAYLGAALAVAQALEIVGDAFAWPNVVSRLVVVTLALGLPVALTVAWYHGHRALRHISVGESSIL